VDEQTTRREGATVADYFEHWPTPLGKLVGIAGHLAREARQVDGNTREDVQREVRRAAGEVEGQLKVPVERSADPFVRTSTDVAEAAWYAGGVVMRFAEAVRIYNVGIDKLNAQVDDLNRSAIPDDAWPAKIQALRRQQAQLRTTLDAEATRVAGMLDRGPNPADWFFLRDHGYLPLGKGDPRLARALASQPPGSAGPGAMREWWAKLPVALQVALMTHYPGRLGNANGLPAEVRDEANRIRLDEDYEKVVAKVHRGESLTDAEKNVIKTVNQIKEREAHLDPLTGKPVPVQLYIYDPAAFDGDGRVAISIGDLDEADHVAVNVRGATNVQGLTSSRSENVYDEARYARSGTGDSVAVLEWMGYDAPNGSVPDADRSDYAEAAGVADDDMAWAGGKQLVADIDGLRASRSDDPAHLTVIGHSYGSTTAAAAARQGLDADDLVLVGSPGVPVYEAGDLPTGGDHTWVGSGSTDPFAAGLNGNDPDQDGFDARRFRAEHVDRGQDVDGFDVHKDSYFGKRSEGLFNIGAIVAGEYDEVHRAEYDSSLPWGEDPEANRQPREAYHTDERVR
jgi:alpha/beta hydrolase family protein